MDQRSIVLYVARKELSGLAIHHDSVATLGPEAVSYSSVARYLYEDVFVSSNSPANIPEAERQFDDCDQAILFSLAEQLFAPIRELPRLTHLPRPTVHRCLSPRYGVMCAIFDGFSIFCHTLNNWIA
jgi:hypothetical protein